MDDKHDYRLRSDCLNHCIDNGLNREYPDRPSDISDGNNCTKCLDISEMLWRRDSFKNNLEGVKLCHNYGQSLAKCFIGALDKQDESELKQNIQRFRCHRDVLSRVDTECQVKCPQHCINHYYNYDVKTESDWCSKRPAFITIVDNQIPDQINENIPEMTFISFAASFGGLLGMWLGLSALTLFHYIIKLL